MGSRGGGSTLSGWDQGLDAIVVYLRLRGGSLSVGSFISFTARQMKRARISGSIECQCFDRNLVMFLHGKLTCIRYFDKKEEEYRWNEMRFRNNSERISTRVYDA